MLADANVYPPFMMSPVRLLIVLGVIAVSIMGRFLTRRVLARLAIRAQRNVVQAAQTKDPQLLAGALQQLDSLYAAYMRREMSAAVAVEQASSLVREVYDIIMNHQTRYQARYEISARGLQKLSDLVQHAYPVEFTDSKHAIPDEAVAAIFAKAKEVVESCR